MSGVVLQGYHFTPSEEELIDILKSFLEYKSQKKKFPSSPVAERVMYGDNASPWRVFGPGDAWEVEGDVSKIGLKNSIHVLTQLSALSAKKTARTAGCGTWDGQTGGKEILNKRGEIIGTRKMLSFKVKENLECQNEAAGQGFWRMHEYSLSGVSLQEMMRKNVDIDNYVICKIIRDFSRCENQDFARMSAIEVEDSIRMMKEMTLQELVYENQIERNREQVHRGDYAYTFVYA